MIPERNKDLFIAHVAEGMELEAAASAAHISVPTIYRFLRDPAFRIRYEDTKFSAKEKIRKQKADQGMTDLKTLVLKRRR